MTARSFCHRRAFTGNRPPPAAGFSWPRRAGALLLGALVLSSAACTGRGRLPSQVGAPGALPEPIVALRHAELPDPGASAARGWTAIMVRDTGWTLDQVRATLREAAATFARECALHWTVEAVLVVQVRAQYRVLDEGKDERLARSLAAHRPALFFVGATAQRDMAYSYLEGIPGERAGTAWLTRGAGPSCRGPLAGHEVRLPAVHEAVHSADPENFMHGRCVASNVAGHLVPRRIDLRQCAALRQRPEFAARGNGTHDRFQP